MLPLLKQVVHCCVSVLYTNRPEPVQSWECSRTYWLSYKIRWTSCILAQRGDCEGADWGKYIILSSHSFLLVSMFHINFSFKVKNNIQSFFWSCRIGIVYVWWFLCRLTLRFQFFRWSSIVYFLFWCSWFF